MNTWHQHKRMKKREQTLQGNILYRQSLREVYRNERSVERLCSQYEAQAIEAERTGQHDLAVRLAAQQAQLRKHQIVSSGMRGSLEVAHAVQSSNQAMAEIMEDSRRAANSLLASASSPDACATQMELESMREHVQTFLDDSAVFYEDFVSGEDEQVNEEGERCLRTLMSAGSKEKQRRLLHDTNTQLERLQRNRLMDREGGRK